MLNQAQLVTAHTLDIIFSWLYQYIPIIDTLW